VTSTRAAIAVIATSAAAVCGCGHFPWGTASAKEPIGSPAANPGEESEQQFEIKMLTDTSLAQSKLTNSPDDAVVRIVGPTMCSGTLIAEDLVLTAHHCVVARGRRGEVLSKLVPAKDVDVQLGGDLVPLGSVGVTAIVAPPCGEVGGRGDVAVLVLERKLVGIRTLSLAEDPPKPGEVVDAMGFGRCMWSPEGIRRRHREGGPVLETSASTLTVDASICPGDSGGPVVDRASRRVLGVVSLSAMDYDENTRGRSLFARVDAFPKVVAYARQIADGADPSDIPPLACE
jgi:hypothetical protein